MPLATSCLQLRWSWADEASTGTVTKPLHIWIQVTAEIVTVPLRLRKPRKRAVVIHAKRCAKLMPPSAGLLAAVRMSSSANGNTTLKNLTSRRAKAAV